MPLDANPDIRVHTGRIITAKEYATRQAEKVALRAARSEADQVLAAAQAEAARIIEDAEARAAAKEAELRRIADKELDRFVETHAIDEAAKAVQEVMVTSHTLRNDFDEMTPWMSDFVVSALERIIGEMPPKKLYGKLLRQALREQRTRWDLSLRCHPDLVRLFEDVLSKDKRLAAAIVSVDGDRDLPKGSCHLVSKKGVLDISVKTQLRTLLRAFETMMEDGK